MRSSSSLVVLLVATAALPARADQEAGRRPSSTPLASPSPPSPSPLPPVAPAPLGPSSEPAIEYAYERAMATEADPAASAAHKRDAWCALAGFTERNPYLEGARRACEAWSAFCDRREASLAKLREDYARLRALLALARPGRDERLRVVDEFLATHAALHGEPTVAAVAAARIELEEAGSAEAAREVRLPLIGPDGVRDDSLELEIDLGPVSLLYGGNVGGAIGYVGFVAGGLQPFSDPYDGTTRKFGLESVVAAGSPIEVGVGLAYRDGSYAPGRTDTFDGRWGGLALGTSLGLTVISAPDLNEYESSLLNLSGGLAFEGVVGSRPTESSSHFYGTLGAYAANTIYLGCSTALRVAWIEPISHGDLIPAHLEATIGLDSRESCNEAAPPRPNPSVP